MRDLGDVPAACALYDSLRAGGGNLCVSPLSVRLAFALCYIGAGGRTADELREAFRFPSQPETKMQFAALLGKLTARGAHAGPAVSARSQREEGPRFLAASRLWLAARCTLREEFASAAREAFGAPVERLDFAGDLEGSRATMNAWVEQVTNGKIVDLIAGGQLDPATLLVATSAAYFRAQWAESFREELTEPAPFFAPGRTIEVPLMQQTTRHLYGESHAMHVVELGYRRSDFVMRIAVPTAEQGLARAEAAAAEILALPLRDARLRLFMPRFRCASHFMLGGALSAMGVTTVFRYGEADLSGIDGTLELYVSSVVHEAFVDVDEHGTEAAAATALVTRLGSAPGLERSIEVRIDRPFLFWIVDRPTGTVLFSGRVVDPTAGARQTRPHPPNGG
jgi:serpin B